MAWRIGGVDLTAASGRVDVPLAGRPNGVRMTFAVDRSSRELTVSNLPADGSYSVPVVCTATAPTDAGSVTGTALYSVVGIEEGWGEDYLQFQDWWNDITHPIPIEIIKPRWWLSLRRERIETEVAAVSVLNPELAEAMRRISAEETRVIAG